MGSAKKRRVDTGSSGSGGVHSTAAATSTGGGGQHSTATTGLMFVDCGYVDKELQNHLIESARRTPDSYVMEQIEEVIDEFEPDIVVKPKILQTTETPLGAGSKWLGRGEPFTCSATGCE